MHDCSRRQFLLAAAAGVTAAAMITSRAARGQSASTSTTSTSPATTGAPTTAGTTVPVVPVIDRKALVTRHTITLSAIDPATVLHVGNGDFAFGCDATGLQTFAGLHATRVPLETIATWAWLNVTSGDATTRAATKLAANVDAAAVGQQVVPAALPANRASLTHLAFVARDGAPLDPGDVSNIEQTLDLWRGTIYTRFDYRGEPVVVTTVAHPSRSMLGVRVAAPTLASGDLAIRVILPGMPDERDDERPSASRTLRSGVRLERQLGDFTYVTRLDSAAGPRATLRRDGPHAFTLVDVAREVDLVMELSPAIAPTPRPVTATTNAVAAADDEPLPGFADVESAAAKHWEAFWSDGAAIDFAGSTDVRAAELERRVVLSQYLTAVHCAGTLPPPATGLAFDRWRGHAAIDLHLWNTAHFAMWGRLPLLERSLRFYKTIEASARETAKQQGYQGARWPRRCGPDGREGLEVAGPLMIWQQPHPIYLAELAYRAKPTRETLEKYGEIVEQTARFMASYARFDAENKRYVLGPPLVPAQPIYAIDGAQIINPTFELAYWAWGLTVAQKWRNRTGTPREPLWDELVQQMSKPTVREERYMAIEVEPFLINAGQPSFLMALGLLPKSHLIDEATMRESARWTRAKWKWNESTGVDFATLAQTAARVGDPELALESLLMQSERNRYGVAGHNPQDQDLIINLPSNGALLAAVAMMAGGWDGATTEMPGFPKSDKWSVRCEGFSKVI